MIEDAMFLALGFFVAMLLALACVPILWARAMRLTRYRLELQVPLSAGEIEAGQDALRAEAAVSQRRLEQALDASRNAAARLSADLGHRTVSLVGAERTIAALEAERTTLTDELWALGRTARDEEAQRVAMEKVLHDADAQIGNVVLDLQAQRERCEASTALAKDRLDAAVALEVQNVGLRATIASRHEEVAQLTSCLKLTRASVAELTRERDAARNEVLLAATRRQIVEAQLRIEIERGRERDQRGAARRHALDQEAGTIMDQTEAGTDDIAPLTDLKQQIDSLQARLAETPAHDGPGREREDRAIRSAIVALGEAALRQLDPRDDSGASSHAAEDKARPAAAQP